MDYLIIRVLADWLFIAWLWWMWFGRPCQERS